MEIQIINGTRAEGVKPGAIQIHFDTFRKLINPSVLEEDAICFDSTLTLCDAAATIKEVTSPIVIEFIANKLIARKNLILKAIAGGKTHFDTEYYEVSVHLNRIEYIKAKKGVK